jgi:hypothetical protein
MPILVQDLSTQATPTSNVQQKGRLVLWQCQQLHRSMGHLRLDGLDSGAGGKVSECDPSCGFSVQRCTEDRLLTCRCT